MHLIRKYNKTIRFLLCIIDIYSKYVWVVPLKDSKGFRITNICFLELYEFIITFCMTLRNNTVTTSDHVFNELILFNI